MTDLLTLLVFIGLFCGCLAVVGVVGRVVVRRRQQAEQDTAEADRRRFVMRRVQDEEACRVAQQIMRQVNYPEYDPPLQPRAVGATPLWRDEHGQDVAEYAVMLAVILVLVIGTVRLVGGNANNVFSSVGSNLSQ
jgi:Flp pilus assembly pilin Flp